MFFSPLALHILDRGISNGIADEAELDSLVRLKEYQAALVRVDKYCSKVTKIQRIMRILFFYVIAFCLQVYAYCASIQRYRDFNVNGVEFRMMYIKGGNLVYANCNNHGTRNDSDVSANIKLNAYYIAETEVTQELWTAVMGNNPSWPKGNNLPINNVSWYDCQTFIDELNFITGEKFHLPTEAEWEFAVNGGQVSNPYDYSGGDVLDVLGWYDSNSNRTIHQVKGKLPNSIGIFDMSGNVAEWCEDKYDETGFCRVIRGGDYESLSSFCHTIWSMHSEDWKKEKCLGFRIVLTDKKRNLPTQPLVQSFNPIETYAEECSYNNIFSKMGEQKDNKAFVVHSPWREIGYFDEQGYAWVEDYDGKYGFINRAGDVIVPCEWNSVGVFEEEVCRVVNEQGLYGYINRRGINVIPCKWQYATDFDNGIAVVRDERENNGCINKDGEIILPCQYNFDNPYLMLDFHSGMSVFRDTNGKYGCIDINGHIVVNSKWDWIRKSGSLLYVKDENEKWGCINKNGKTIIQCKWDDIHSFSNGYALVQGPNKLYGYLDKRGNMLTQCIWKYGGSFCEGYACVQDVKGLYGYINTLGDCIIPCQWKDADYSFSDGLARVQNATGLYGFIDRRGEIAIQCKFLNCNSFNNGLAVVGNKDGQYGYIDKVGNLVIPYMWKEADDFDDNGLAVVKDNKGLAFVIDKAGNIVLPKQEKRIADLQPQQSFCVNGILFNMVRVDCGTLHKGAIEGEEKPMENVEVSSFYIGETEVSQELWLAVMGSNPSFFRGLKLPVEQVSWNDCQEFITRLNKITGRKFRLPTSDEWEFAARGGNRGYNHIFSGSNIIDDVAWYYVNSGEEKLKDNDWENFQNDISVNKCKTHVVKQKRANGLGLYDMTGNVMEWCQDSYEIFGIVNYRCKGGCYLDFSNFCQVWRSLGNQADCLGMRLAMMP